MLEGITEADETYLLESDKGKRNLSRKPRKRGGSARRRGNPTYRAFCRTEGISHEAVNLSQGQRVKGACHVQNVNAYHSRFKLWLERFHSVATDYLPLYIGWRRIFEQHQNPTPQWLLNAALGNFQQLTVT